MSQFDLIQHLQRQREFSLHTFGPGERTAGVLDHIRKELVEIEEHPTDIYEWVDVLLLAFDGAYRAGFTPEEIAAAIERKQTINEGRSWPDWRTAEPGKAIGHLKSDRELLLSLAAKLATGKALIPGCGCLDHDHG